MKAFTIVGVLLLLYACEQKQNTKVYACVSHTRLNNNSGIDSTIAQSNLSKYNALLLGGDLANLSSYNDSILTYLDKVFDLDNETTMWALGNHDYSNVDLIKTHTNRNNYYAHYQDKTIFLVLDTQMDSSKISGQQLDFFNAVMDTITKAKNLIVLTHKLIWMRSHTELEQKINDVSNGHFGDCDYCIQENNFYKDIYPRLVEFKLKIGDVFCVAGDVGFKAKKIDYLTSDGIQFLGTGIKANSENNVFLKLTNDLKSNKISFEFEKIEKL